MPPYPGQQLDPDDDFTCKHLADKQEADICYCMQLTTAIVALSLECCNLIGAANWVWQTDRYAQAAQPPAAASTKDTLFRFTGAQSLHTSQPLSLSQTNPGFTLSRLLTVLCRDVQAHDPVTHPHVHSQPRAVRRNTLTACTSSGTVKHSHCLPANTSTTAAGAAAGVGAVADGGCIGRGGCRRCCT